MKFEIVPKAFAQCQYGQGVDLSECLLLNDGTTVKSTYSNASVLVNLIVGNLFIFAGIILFFLTILAGYKFIAGGKKGVDEAKTLISTAITGFIIMFSAYWIVQIVELLTGASVPL